MAVVASDDSSGTGATVGISGYSNFAPCSHLKIGQQSGNAAVLFVFSEIGNHDIFKQKLILIKIQNLCWLLF